MSGGRMALALVLYMGMARLGSAQTVQLGTWEGVIEDPRRPIVMMTDFNGRAATLSGGAPIPLALQSISAGDTAVEFVITQGAQNLRFAGRRLGEMITGVVNTGTRTLPFWLEPIPDLKPPANRVDAWRQDLDVVLTRFLRYDRSFSNAERAAARARVEQLKEAVDRLPDAKIMVELARAIALSGNAHTRLYFARNRTEVRRLPIRVWWFGNELRVVRAQVGHRDLLGCRVIAVAETDVDSAFRMIRDIKAGNASWQRYMSAYFLTSSDVLYGAGVSRDTDHVPLTVVCGEASRTATLAPLPLRRSTAPVEAWWDLAPSFPHPDSSFIPALSAGRAPLFLRNVHENYRFEYLPDAAVLYLQYNRAQQMPGKPMSDFIESVARALKEHTVKGFVVDLRFNTGGDAGVGTPLVETLAGMLKGTPVFVLTSRATFSAGITHAVQWKTLAGATVIGEPVGDELDMWSEGGNIVLPNSRLTVHYANGFHAYSPRDYPEFRPYFADLNVGSLEPDVVVEQSWADYAAGRDRVLEVAMSRLRDPPR
ncbi:MAG: hypothetical protein ACRENP_16195 [Longimicrobiales bacterium]